MCCCYFCLRCHRCVVVALAVARGVALVAVLVCVLFVVWWLPCVGVCFSSVFAAHPQADSNGGGLFCFLLLGSFAAHPQAG